MSEGIAYQNKDILFKILGRTYKEKNIDNLFLLEDGTYAIVDYESVYKKAKFL